MALSEAKFPLHVGDDPIKGFRRQFMLEENPFRAKIFAQMLNKKILKNGRARRQQAYTILKRAVADSCASMLILSFPGMTRRLLQSWRN
jgi:hypothetical protein